MLDNKGFDLWADSYDRSTGASDEEGTYPFAGYGRLLNEIYNRVLTSRQRNVLELGLGTGALAAGLYARGCTIFGQDFSGEMLRLAREKMPDALLCQGDFSMGLAEPLGQRRYDAIIATYALHHLTDPQKAALLQTLLPLLADGGCLYIGDVAFATRRELEACRTLAGEEWDDEEFYFVAEDWTSRFPQMRFEPVSFCAGLFTLAR